jgi:hypothetical protein
MIRGLLGKELRQHGFTLTFLFLMLIGALALIAGNAGLRRALGGGFAGVQLLHHTYVPLVCLVLGQILIATEFRQKTQLFLEGLPLPRWRMLAVKFTLGLAVLVGAVAAALLVAWWSARGSEAMTPRFAALVALKSAGWVWFMYALCFAHAFLGRYRVPFGIVLFFGFIALQSSGVRLSDFGPFALVNERFAYERHVFPGAALAVAAACGLGLAALGFALGLVRDASVASLLAERMSPREKVFMTFLMLISMSTSAWLWDHYRTATPVRMPGAFEAQRGLARVFAAAAVDAPSREETAALERAATRAAEELGALAEYLGCKTFPPIFIVHRRDLAGGEYAGGELKPSQGALGRVNLTAKEFAEVAWHEWLICRALSAHTGGLAWRERNAWALDGLAHWWPRRADPTPAADAPSSFSARDFDRWFTVERDHGAERAHELAVALLAKLAEQHGEEARRKFLGAMFGAARPDDSRGWLLDVMRSREARLREAAGIDETALVAALLPRSKGP